MYCFTVSVQEESNGSILQIPSCSATHAIEFDFGDHWSEAVGQSAYYALQTGKKAGIVLILETMKDRKYWIRLNTTIEYFYFTNR
jgi:hypothetical protein